MTALLNALETLADADNKEPLEREAFLQRFARCLQDTVFISASAGSGVNCRAAKEVRGLEFDHVFFGGLTEGITPAPPSSNAIYSDRDIRRLRAADIPLEGKREHDEHERIVFHHVLDTARVSLTLSWHMLMGGREAMRSPFLSEVAELFEGHASGC